MKRRYHVIFNANSGTALAQGLTTESLEESFTKHGLEVTIDANGDTPLAKRIATAKASKADVIVAAGGDGTVTAVAEAIVDSPQALGILPLGTANLLARDLSLPLDLNKAVEALDGMVERRIDVGDVNGRAFLHNVSIGVIPSIAVAREKIRGKPEIGAKVGFARYFMRRLSTARRIAAEITPRAGEPRIVRAHAIAVTNNDYEAGLGRIFARDRLDGGSLSVFVLRRLGVIDVVRLATEMVLGTWREDAAIEIENVNAVTIRMHGRLIKAMVDGEVQSLDLPLRFRIRPGALAVLAPPPPQDVPVEEPEYAVGI